MQQQLITITQKATEEIKNLLTKNKKESFRIRVVEGGCSGHKYIFELEEKPSKNDEVIQQEGIKVLIDQESIKFLKSSTVDYIETLENSGFKISNPNAKSSCGCGSSFGV
ncbi:MAG: iron-sulfur cluster assembly accessory protein [Candidatus Woesearchaeota archaeon]|nr:MAG: iron-sulfur cluster assembly accessory protein [Candidatus Woesearchaeota archaeon]